MHHTTKFGVANCLMPHTVYTLQKPCQLIGLHRSRMQTVHKPLRAVLFSIIHADQPTGDSDMACPGSCTASCSIETLDCHGMNTQLAGESHRASKLR